MNNADQSPVETPQLPSVSLGFVLKDTPTRVEAITSAFTAVLHAGFCFGRDRPGQVVYSYDPQGEHYAEPIVVPAGSIRGVRQALVALSEVAQHYNQSVALSFCWGQNTIPVTGRVYDELGSLAVSLDFGKAGWQQLVALCLSARGATIALIDVGRTLFTLLPACYLLVGPTSLLLELPGAPTNALLQASPVAMLPSGHDADLTADSEHVESLPRGSIIVRRWDASAAVELGIRRPRIGDRRGKSTRS